MSSIPGSPLTWSLAPDRRLIDHTSRRRMDGQDESDDDNEGEGHLV